MKKATTLIIFTFILLTNAFGQTKQQIENEISFCKLYGYVRYFHPSDEASALDWDKFAVYAIGKVKYCADKQALKKTLTDLFRPIAPTLQLADYEESVAFDKKLLTPPSLSGYKTIAWQHIGVGTLKFKESAFQSARTNRNVFYEKYNAAPLRGESMSKSLNAKPHQGKPFILKGQAKLMAGTGFGHFWARVDKIDKSQGFFDNSFNNLIKQQEWMDFEISGVIDADAERLRFGVLLEGAGNLQVDNISLSIKQDSSWKEVYSNTFNSQTEGDTATDPLNAEHKTNSNIYTYGIGNDSASPDEKWAEIKSNSKYPQDPIGKWENHTSLFKAYPQVGEHIIKDIGSGLKAIMPISLYGNNDHTYPAADNESFKNLKIDLASVNKSAITADSANTRIGDIVITWNIFQHFFPYLDVAKTDWQHNLREALIAVDQNKNAADFYKSLKKLTAKLQDAHVYVNWTEAKDNFYLPISWTWAENELVITQIPDNLSGLKKGDIVTAINGGDAKNYFTKVEQYISASTPELLKEKALMESLKGNKNTNVILSYATTDGRKGEASIKRSLTGYDYNKLTTVADTIKYINNDITYVNMGLANMKAIDKILPRLQKNKAIICDFRNCKIDNGNNHFIEYLLTKKDTAAHWLQNAQRIYPDQQKTIGYITEGFELRPAKPHLTAKIIFITDASDYSWAESYMGIIDHYKLATIIGQPTGGTNGDVNSFTLPGGYAISFTGLKVTQLDGSQHFGIGTKPNIYISKTIKGIRENRDEFLEKAIELAETPDNGTALLPAN